MQVCGKFSRDPALRGEKPRRGGAGFSPGCSFTFRFHSELHNPLSHVPNAARVPESPATPSPGAGILSSHAPKKGSTESKIVGEKPYLCNLY